MSKNNYWVWTELTQLLKPDRKAGDPVPIEYLIEGYTEYFPYAAWIKKGYVEKIKNTRSGIEMDFQEMNEIYTKVIESKDQDKINEFINKLS